MIHLVLNKNKVAKFEKAFDELERRFKGYYDGNLSDNVKLTATNGKPDLKFIKPVPEIVRVAVCTAFVNTLL